MTEREKSEKLSIEEIVEHCNRTCEKMELFAASKGKSQDEIADKTYWEHYQVKNYLKEIQQYRSIGTPEEVIQIKRQNRVLRNRCRILSGGQLCIFCPIKCEERAEEFRNAKGGGVDE